MAFDAILRLEEQLLIVGHMRSAEKVGAFLLKMAERLSGSSVDSVSLPMSRYDIADYLAVSVETVSRALTGLKHRGAITFVGTRQVRIVDRRSLEE
jgi:CRP-like cAMP-binding protein